MFPKAAVGSVSGIGGTAGAVGGILMAWFIGRILQNTGSYTLIFIVAGLMYLIALAIIHVLSPKLAPVNLD